jgi:hypothetical protein
MLLLRLQEAVPALQAAPLLSCRRATVPLGLGGSPKRLRLRVHPPFGKTLDWGQPKEGEEVRINDEEELKNWFDYHKDYDPSSTAVRLVLDLQEARAARKAYLDWCDKAYLDWCDKAYLDWCDKAYLDWCDNKDGSATIPYKVLDDLRKCVENE